MGGLIPLMVSCPYMKDRVFSVDGGVFFPFNEQCVYDVLLPAPGNVTAAD